MKRLIAALALSLTLLGCSSSPLVACNARMSPVTVEVYEDGAWIEGKDRYTELSEYIHDLESCVLLDSVALR